MAKILVIDDSPSIRASLDILLREAGYEVLVADNGWTGMACYLREHPDVILLDLNMPVLDGISVLAQIRATDLNQKVIVMTGDTNPDTERNVRALGVSEFIIKSVSLQTMTDAVKHLLKDNPSGGNLAA
jgi:DNA-binding NtrC family response regulator